MNQFFVQLSSVSPMLPSIVRAIVVALVLILAWIAVALPAFLLWRSIEKFLISARSVLQAFAKECFARAKLLLASAKLPIEHFLDEHAQMFSFAEENRQIRLALSRIAEAADNLQVDAGRLEKSLAECESGITAASNSINRVLVPEDMQPPDPNDFSRIKKGHNRALVTLVFVAPVIIAAGIVNAYMLNQFFGYMTESMGQYGATVAILISLAFVVVEVGLGIVASSSTNALRVAALLAILFLASIEFLFYAGLGQNFKQVFVYIFSPNPVPFWTRWWFGVFGPALVLCLSGTGHLLFSSVALLADTHVVRQWRRHLVQRHSHVDQLNQSYRVIGRSRDQLADTLSNLTVFVSRAQENAGSAAGVLHGAKAEIKKQVERAQAIRLEDSRRLDRGAMLRKFYESLFIVLAIILVFVGISYVYEIRSLRIIATFHGGWWLGIALALSETVALLLAGNAVHRTSYTLPAAEGIPGSTLPIDTIGRISGFAMLAVVILGNAFITARLFTVEAVIIFLILTTFALVLLYCGTRLGMTLASVSTATLSLFYLLGSAINTSLGVMAFAMNFIFLFFQVLLYAASYPIQLILDRRSGRESIVSPAPL